ncbi:phosphoribosylanthranilate isomerase [Virgibacillus profundi]|uniref:N-(5'-phosphoribosyl)anthranilate isomerase n=1 Tax=Virgibacillus profundi TaxID=2024555 RepID=A0A2A2IH21_9BACI|nr:phosphoribosylanthranilate isomerase [Virgibacillus profundi]PAV30544.1 phosphoribosylanthranilate isomerase [Virgibacillus profundi]PXY54716.1 phosphoribosylanthranilate isomerase [Virgibacillus profundi]
MIVKICGIKNKEAASTAAKAGADLIGFVFAGGKRQITPEDAAEIAETLPSSVQKVGVFVNETPEKMQEIAELVGLDFIQLHGDEPHEVAESLPYKIIKAFPVHPERLKDIQGYPCDYYLLDSPFGKNRGGNGTTFDWNLTEKLSLDPSKILLAGGLSQENVTEAIKLVMPAGVDVSSGVETNGVKDLTKIKRFTETVRSTGKDETIDNIYNA